MMFSSGMARIEAMLQQLMLERQSGLREGSVISLESIASAEEGDEDIWYQIGRELEDVGITPDMLNEHRPYITAWIMEALSSGNLDEDPMLASPDLDTSSSELPCQAPLQHTLQGRELITQDEHAEDRSDVPHDTFDSRPEEAMDLGNTPDTSMETEESLRPGDVTLSDIQRKGYLCTHASCQETPEQSFTSWFELLLHARNYHCPHAPPWSLSPNNSDLQAVSTPSDPSYLARAENGDWLFIESLQCSTSLSDELRLELNYMLTVLYEAVFSGSIPPEIPQLMYDLYYTTVCQFKDCQKSSKDSNEHRSVTKLWIVICADTGLSGTISFVILSLMKEHALHQICWQRQTTVCQYMI